MESLNREYSLTCRRAEAMEIAERARWRAQEESNESYQTMSNEIVDYYSQKILLFNS